MSKPDQRVKGLNEVVLRVKNLDAMQHFYEAVVGLELMRRFPSIAFLKIGDGYAGLTQVLALFDASLSGDTEQQRLEQLGLTVETAQHAWLGWRSLYFRDPEGNVVELVCSDSRRE